MENVIRVSGENLGHSHGMDLPRLIRRNMFDILSSRRIASIPAFPIGVLSVGILCSVVFSSIGSDTHTGIKMMGSLTGNLLMLSAGVILLVKLSQR